MKKSNLFTLFVLIALFAIVPALVAQAREDEAGDDRGGERGRPTSTIKTTEDSDDSEDGNAKENRGTTTGEMKKSENAKATSTDDSGDDSDEDEDKDNKGRGEEYRSEVANAVKKLLEVANRQGGIGAEVREIAREQEESAATTTEAIKEIEDRGGFKTFLIGSDYKNIGKIRSELANTEKRIERLEAAVGKLPAGADKTELENQITALKQAQADLNEFVEENEDKFSLFGWMVRLFGE